MCLHFPVCRMPRICHQIIHAVWFCHLSSSWFMTLLLINLICLSVLLILLLVYHEWLCVFHSKIRSCWWNVCTDCQVIIVIVIGCLCTRQFDVCEPWQLGSCIIWLHVVLSHYLWQIISCHCVKICPMMVNFWCHDCCPNPMFFKLCGRRCIVSIDIILCINAIQASATTWGTPCWHY